MHVTYYVFANAVYDAFNCLVSEVILCPISWTTVWMHESRAGQAAIAATSRVALNF